MLDYKANPLVVAPRLDTQLVPSGGAVGSKTGKTSVLPGFSKIEHRSVMVVLPSPGAEIQNIFEFFDIKKCPVVFPIYESKPHSNIIVYSMQLLDLWG